MVIMGRQRTHVRLCQPHRQGLASLHINLEIAQDYSWLNPFADLAFLKIAGSGGVWDYRTNQRCQCVGFCYNNFIRN
jgi:hypothetical protein